MYYEIVLLEEVCKTWYRYTADSMFYKIYVSCFKTQIMWLKYMFIRYSIMNVHSETGMRVVLQDKSDLKMESWGILHEIVVHSDFWLLSF